MTIPIGTIVRVEEDHEYGGGLIGKVVSHSTFLDDEESVGVDFLVITHFTHDLDGTLSRPTGRYYLEDNLEIIGFEL